MANTHDLRILRPEDSEAILAFEQRRLRDTIPDEMEREFASWSAPWRPEALNHYLPLGWSLGAFTGAGEQPELSGYLLAQPLLFFHGLTQTLWVERVSFDQPQVGQSLAEASWRWARDKHFQKLILGSREFDFDLVSSLGAKMEEQRWIAMATSRMKT